MTMIVKRFRHQSFINPCNWSVMGEDLVLVANTGTLQDVFCSGHGWSTFGAGMETLSHRPITSTIINYISMYSV
ncbi:hypothetical protein BDV34DRAFT_195410 [Aspergillus parasiticus]|uniref:Uncharacterized protein n=1 Tax=Aspergillus parasiticus TaxID=5067 RepID=A0A5N6DKM5_ASPPA|nr:hypothetical protein BDV34DRAFT_195410 [Aspergillus parasiticus]